MPQVKVLDRKRAGDKITDPTPVTVETIPFALAMLFRQVNEC